MSIVTVHPILAALRKHKAGAILIALQIALTLAIVCNALFIIGHRLERLNRPTGVQESDLFIVQQSWVNTPNESEPDAADKLDAMQLEDLAALRHTSGIASVSAINSLPLLGSAWNGFVSLDHFDSYDSANQGMVRTTFYFGDDQMFTTLGLRVIAGRAFTSADVTHKLRRDNTAPSVVVLTKPLADKLFPNGDAVGKAIYFIGSKPVVVVGVVDPVQTPSKNDSSWSNSFAYNAVLVPQRLDAGRTNYAVRAEPGRLDEAMRAARATLYSVNPMRVLDRDSITSFATIRQDAYAGDVGMAFILSLVCLILIAVTAVGIVGMTSFWVSQRYRQIGVRRALGARKIDILHYFQIENLFIASFGVLLGIFVAFELNWWLMSHYEIDRLPTLYVLVCALLVFAIGQGAVFVPALKASKVPPMAAVRAT